MKKYGWLLAIVMILAVALTAATALADYGTPITLNETVTVNVTSEGVEQSYSFTPAETGQYTLQITEYPEEPNLDGGLFVHVHLSLYDKHFQWIKDNGSSNDSLHSRLESGQTYYFTAGLDNHGGRTRTGTFQIKLVRDQDGIYCYTEQRESTATQTDLFASIETDGDNYSYQWYKVDPATMEIGEGTLTELSGETGLHLKVPYSDQYRVYALVVTENGNAENKAEYRTMVYPMQEISAVALTSRKITVQPTSDEPVTMTVAAASKYGDISYSWEKWDRDEGFVPVAANGNGPSYTAAAVMTEGKRQAEKYRCTITNDESGDYAEIEFDIVIPNGLELLSGDYSYVYRDPKESVVLDAEAFCRDGVPSYQWYQVDYDDNKTLIEGETGPTFTAPPCTYNVKYACLISDQYGNWVEKTCLVYPNYIIHQQQGVSLTGYVTIPAEEGEEPAEPVQVSEDGEIWLDEAKQVVLSVRATPEGEYTYQWFKETALGSEPVEGATGDSYTVTKATEYESYFCFSYDGDEAQGYFHFSFSIDDDAFSVRGEENEYCQYLHGYSDFCWVEAPRGESVQLEVTVTGADESSLEYLWLGRMNGYNTQWQIISSGTNVLTVPIDGRQMDIYECFVSDGTQTKYVQFWLNEAVTTPIQANAAIVTPIVLTPSEEDPITDVELAVNVSGGTTETPTICWYRLEESEVNPTNTTLIPLAGSGITLTIPADEVRSGRYVCFVSDGKSDATVYFDILVDNGFSVTYEGSGTVKAGEAKTLTVTAESNYPKEWTYQWYKFLGGYAAPIEGATEATYVTEPLYSINNYGPRSAYYYYGCIVSDGYNRICEMLEIVVEKQLTVSVVGENYFSQYGEEITLEVEANNGDDEDTIHYFWFETWWEDRTQSRKRIAGADTNKYTFIPQNSNNIQCVVIDDYGNQDYVSFWNYISVPIEYEGDRYPHIHVDYDGSATLETLAQQEGQPTLTYQWTKAVFDENGQTIDWTPINCETYSLELTHITERQIYRCLVENGFTSIDFQFTVTVNGGLQVQGTTPWEISLTAGEGATFGVEATATAGGTIQYRWTYGEYHPDWGGQYAGFGEIIGTEPELTVSSIDSTRCYHCRIFTEYESLDIEFYVRHVWDPQVIIEGEETVYEWASSAQHRKTVGNRMYKKCVDDPYCSEILEVPDPEATTELEDHEDADGDGICDICGFVSEGDVHCSINDYGDLVISGYGILETDENGDVPWQDQVENIQDIQRIHISNGIAGIGADVFAGFDHPVRVDFLGKQLPEIDGAAFTDTEAVCRYYNNDDSWAYAGDYSGSLTWIQLTTYVENDYDCYLDYGINEGEGWRVIYYSPTEQNWFSRNVTETEAMEITFRHRDIEMYHGQLTINADVDCLHVYYSSDTTDSVTVNGNVGDLYYYDKTYGEAYYRWMGTLTVNGTIRNLFVYCTGAVMIPNIGEDGADLAVSISMQSASLSDVEPAGPIAAGGVFLLEDAGTVRALTKENSRLYYYWQNDGSWTLYFEPKDGLNGSPFSIDNLSEYKADFSLDDVYRGEDTWVSIIEKGSAGDPLSIAGDSLNQLSLTECYAEVDTPVENLNIFNSSVQVNATVATLYVEDYHNRTLPCSEVILNSSVENLDLRNTARDGMTVSTGKTGSTGNGLWYMLTGANRVFGPVGSNTEIYGNGHLLLMSGRNDQETVSAILPTNAEMDAATSFDGSEAYEYAEVDIEDGSLYSEEESAVAALTGSSEWDEPTVVYPVVVFRIELLRGWQDEWNNRYWDMLSPEQMTGAVSISIMNPTEGISRIVRLDDTDEPVTAEAVETTQDGNVLTFSVDRAGRYAVVSSVAMPRGLDGGWSELTWYTQPGTGVPAQGGAYSISHTDEYYIPYEYQDDEAEAPVWELTTLAGPEGLFELDSNGNDYCRVLVPADGAITPDLSGTAEYRISAVYKGITYYRDVTITLDNTDLTGMDVSYMMASFDPDTQALGDWQQVTDDTAEMIYGGKYVIRFVPTGVDIPDGAGWSSSLDIYDILEYHSLWDYYYPDGSWMFTNTDEGVEATGTGTLNTAGTLSANGTNLRFRKALTVHVTAPGGKLGDLLTVNAPVFVAPGEPFTVSLEEKDTENPVDSEGLKLAVNVYDPDYGDVFNGEAEDTKTITVPGADENENDILTAGKEYELTVTVSKAGCESLRYRTILITGEPSSCCALTVTVDGSPVTGPLYYGDEYTVQITGLPEDLTEMDIHTANSWYTYYESDWADPFTAQYYAYPIECSPVYARFTTEGNPEWQYTNVVIMSVICLHTETRIDYDWIDDTFTANGKAGHTHTGTATRWTVCSICGKQLENLGTTEVSKEEGHSYDDGVCWQCGYACQHENVVHETETDYSVPETIEEIEDNNFVHSVISTGETYDRCEDCDMRLNVQENQQIITQGNHCYGYDENLDGYICEDCRHVCTHELTTDGDCEACPYWCPHETYGDEQTRTEEGHFCQWTSETQHAVYGKRQVSYRICEECGHEWITGSEYLDYAGEEDHDYTGGTCECGDSCPHEGLEDAETSTRVYGPTITRKDPTHHVTAMIRQTLAICPVCGQEVVISEEIDEEIAGTEEECDFDEDGWCSTCGTTCQHSYENGVCKYCHHACSHDFDSKGFCWICGYQCPHEHMDTVVDSETYEYEWLSATQHRVRTIRTSHEECQDCPYCTETTSEPVGEATEEGHDFPDEGGACQICGMGSESACHADLGDNNDLIITGYGVFDDRSTWISEAASIQRIKIGKGITGIGAGTFANLGHTVHIDFLERELPEIDPEAFTGTTAVCRYYNNDASWATAGQYDGALTWMKLPAYVEDDTYCYTEYGRNDVPGWELMYIVNDDWTHCSVTAAEAMETTFRSRYVTLYQIPQDETLRTVYEDHWNLVRGIHFNGNCATPAGMSTYPIELPAGLDESFILEIQSPNLDLTVSSADRIDSVSVSSKSQLTVNGNVNQLTVSNSDNTGSVTINGDVDGLNFHESSEGDNAYLGTLTVDGIIGQGYVYGNGTAKIPKVGENGAALDVNLGHIVISEFSNVTQSEPIAENGTIQIPGVITDMPAYSNENCWLHYTWERGGNWVLTFQPKTNYSSSVNCTIYDLRDYKADFSLDDVDWGNNSDLWIYYKGEDSTPLQIDGDNGQGLSCLIVSNSKVIVNCPLEQLDINDHWDSEGISSDVTINNTVTSLDLYASVIPYEVRTGENGTVTGGLWRRVAYGDRLFGAIGSDTLIYADRTLNVMSWRQGENFAAIMPSESVVTQAAAGLNDDERAEAYANKVSDRELSTEEGAALNAFLAQRWVDETETVFDAIIVSYTNNGYGGIIYGGEISVLNTPVTFTVDNSSGENVYIVRLHEEDGKMKATQLTDPSDDTEIPFTSNLFSKYVIVKTGPEPDLNTLRVLRLPAGLKRIEDEAFMNGNFQAVIIPAGCEYIGKDAFKGCSELVYVSYPEGAEIAEGAFDGCSKLQRVVPVQEESGSQSSPR